jgi:hypothetical protein
MLTIFLVYIAGMILTFPLITYGAYLLLKDDNYVHPSVNGVLEVLKDQNREGFYAISVLIYPAAVIISLIIFIIAGIEAATDWLFSLSSSRKILAARIALLTVGMEIPYTKYSGKSPDAIVNVKILEINKDDIVISMQNKIGRNQYRKIPKENIILYEDNLLILEMGVPCLDYYNR